MEIEKRERNRMMAIRTRRLIDNTWQTLPIQIFMSGGVRGDWFTNHVVRKMRKPQKHKCVLV